MPEIWKRHVSIVFFKIRVSSLRIMRFMWHLQSMTLGRHWSSVKMQVTFPKSDAIVLNRKSWTKAPWFEVNRCLIQRSFSTVFFNSDSRMVEGIDRWNENQTRFQFSIPSTLNNISDMDRGWRGSSSMANSGRSCHASTSEGASLDGSGIQLGVLQGNSLWRFSGTETTLDYPG